jgi:hypothetical protein
MKKSKKDKIEAKKRELMILSAVFSYPFIEYS